MNQSLRSVFDFFRADIITFQELKTEKLSISKWGELMVFILLFLSLKTERDILALAAGLELRKRTTHYTMHYKSLRQKKV